MTTWIRKFAGVAYNVSRNISRIILPTQDISISSAFYAEALRLKTVHESNDGSYAVLSAGDSSRSCELAFSRRLDQTTVNNSTSTTHGPLLFPYLTFGVSNLKTSSRHAKRKLGNVIDHSESEAVFIDPDGNGLRVLHLFRRNPAVSITLGVKSIENSKELYINLLGMRQGTREEEAVMHLPDNNSKHEELQLALSFGDPHNTTSLLINQVSESIPRTETVICIDVPKQELIQLYKDASAVSGINVSPFDDSSDKSFLIEDSDGYVLQVKGN